MEPIVALVLSYLSGSIPFAAIAGRLRGVDLRKQGSGNLGATNVFRVLGWKIGLLVFLADALKGALPVLYLPPRIVDSREPMVWAIACGIAAIVGHVRPLVLKLRKGGKGVATAADACFAFAPIPLPMLLLVTRRSRSPFFLVSVVIALFVFWTHRSNIGRLRRGEEHRFGRGGDA